MIKHSFVVWNFVLKIHDKRSVKVKEGLNHTTPIMTVIESGSHTQPFSIVMWKWSILVPITFMDTINQSGPDIP